MSKTAANTRNMEVRSGAVRINKSLRQNSNNLYIALKEVGNNHLLFKYGLHIVILPKG